MFPSNFKVEVYFKSLQEQDDKIRRPSSAVAYSAGNLRFFILFLFFINIYEDMVLLSSLFSTSSSLLIARSAVETAKLKLGNAGKLPKFEEEEEPNSNLGSQQECTVCLQMIDLEVNLNVYRAKGLYSHWECLK